MSEWREVALGDVIELKRGYDLPSAERRPGSVPIISSSGTSGLHREAKVKGPGVVTGRYGTIGEVFLVESDFWPLNTSLYVRDFKGNDVRFVYYLLKTINWAQYNDKSGVPGVNRNHVHEARVELPEIGVQRAIAHVLGALDDKIKNNRVANETLEALTQLLFKDWFIDFGPVRAKMAGREPPGLNPIVAALFPDSLNEEGIPHGWSWESLASLVELNPSEKLKKGDVAPYLDMSALPTTGSWPRPPIPRPFGSGMKFRNGDTLLARITPCLENGKAAFVECLDSEETVAWGSTEFIVLRAKDNVPQPYCYLLVRQPEFRAHAIRSMGGTSGRQRVQVDSLAPYRVACPPEPIWKAFKDAIQPCFDVIRTNSQESQTLARLRDLLLPKLIAGDIAITIAEAMIGGAL